MMGNIRDEQGWTVAYNRLKTDYQAKRKFSAVIPAQDGQEMLERVSQLERALAMMKDSPMEYELTASEIARRQVIIESLKSKVTIAIGDPKQILKPMEVGSNANNSTPSAQNTNTVNPLLTSDQALLQRQREVIKLQDDMLLDIEKGVDRLHNQARTINQETQLQSKIIDELDTNVDQAALGLEQGRAQAEKVRIQSNTCYMYLCVVVEIIVLLVLVVVLFVKF